MAVTEVQRPALAPQPSPGTRLLAWLTTTDHKRIGILYFWNSFAVFAIAGVMALLMRTDRNPYLRAGRSASLFW